MSLSCVVVAGTLRVEGGFRIEGVLTIQSEMVGFEHQVGGYRKTLNDGGRPLLEVEGGP